jgi:cytochrome P450
VAHPDPLRFDAERFLDKSLGGKAENYSKTVKAFGGGLSYCPGRVFAEKQLMAFFAALLIKYDIDIVTTGWRYPVNADSERVV